MSGGIIETGPDYPPAPSQRVPTNGEIVPFNYWQTVIAQYANSPGLIGIIGSFAAAVDQSANIDAFYRLVMNIDSAVEYGLDCWGRIVGVTRTLYVPDVKWFGFSQGAPNSVGFGQGPFYAGESLNNNYRLADNSYRTLIFAKAMANISDGSIPSINKILMALFPGRGNCYCTDAPMAVPYFGFSQGAPGSVGFGQGPFYMGEGFGGMTMTYTFEFPLSNIELAIVQQSGVLPKPTGVAARVVII
jgi:hypothetical protein